MEIDSLTDKIFSIRIIAGCIFFVDLIRACICRSNSLHADNFYEVLVIIMLRLM